MALHKRIMSEFLHLYKHYRCLWDSSDVSYSNKEIKKQAYETLLDKYKQVQEDATIIDVKRRIENMRTSYRREHKKVLMSRLNDEEGYTPHLWYYHLMTFLDGVSDYSNPETSFNENTQETIKTERLEKKRKISDVPVVYFEHDDVNDNFTSYQDNILSIQDSGENENYSRGTSTSKHLTEAESFGTTVGLQLKELDEMQRVFAEKLISDVIFHARLKKLTISSAIAVSYKENSDRF